MSGGRWTKYNEVKDYDKDGKMEVKVHERLRDEEHKITG